MHATALDGDADGTTEFQYGEEHDLSRFKKMLLGAVTAMVLATGVAVSPASATVPTKGHLALDANVPYLAWRGEHVRLGFCLPPGLGAISTDADVTWSIEDWSGDPANGSIPVPFEILGARQFNNGCVYSEFSSQKAGIAFIKLSIHRNAGVSEPTAALVPPSSTHVVKQYMVAWMELEKPVVTGGGTVNAGDFCQSVAEFRFDLINPYRVCDPALDPRQLITATVKGTIPLLANFSEWGIGTELTMPDDWAKWAGAAARSSQPDNSIAEYMTNWDIHDDQTHVEGHIVNPPGPCVGGLNAVGSTDAVDNCDYLDPVLPTFGGQHGSFSTVLPSLSRSGYTNGPFDPLYTYDTLLSNGTVDPGDAPMPAAQIDLDITPNSGGPSDISGVGYLYPADKAEEKSRDGLGTNAAHNYDQPFYHQWIPATERPADAGGSPYGAVLPTGITGVTGTAFGGFWFNGLYKNWSFAYEESFNTNANSHCLNFRSIPSDNLYWRPLPYGTTGATLYTDEHGEANAHWVPGLGFYFDNIGALKNSNGGCDIENKNPIGTAAVTVTARYPYQPVTARDPAATPINYVVNSLFHKTLAAYAKGPGAENANVRIVLAHAQDIDGSPLAHEVVCWSAQGESYIRLFPTSSAGGSILDQNGVEVAFINANQAKQGYFIDPYSGRQCTTTDEKGNTAIEVGNSEGGTIDVLSEWMNELIFRDILVPFGAAGTPGALSDIGPITHVPSPTTVKTILAATGAGLVGPVLVDGQAVKTQTIKSSKKATKKALHKIRTARVYKPFGGKRVLQVQVNGKSGMVALKITIKLGKKTTVYKRFVLANKKVAVKNLPIPAKTAKVTVSLIS